MDNIILIGGGGHAKACIDVIEQGKLYRVAGIIEKEGSHNDSVLGHSILGYDIDLKKLRNKYEYALITIGQINSPSARINAFGILKSLEFVLPTIKSPLAYVSKHAQIGEGTIIMHGALVNAGAKIGSNCIINSNALVEHDVRIGDHCHISTMAIVNGEVTVGEGTFIGSGAITKQSITIGKSCIIGSGCVLKQNIPDKVTTK